MNQPRSFGRLAAVVDGANARLTRDGIGTGAGSEHVFLDEVHASSTLAGAGLLRPEVAALVQRGVASGERPFEDYVMVADYAEAARYVRRAALPGRRRPYLTVAEVVDIHALAVRRSLHDRPGTWRSTTTAAFASGMVAPPAWLVPQAIAALVERLSQGPGGTAPLFWVAEAHERFERVHPFASANGRVGRLVANLLLRRLGYPPLILTARDASRYFSALARADSGDPWPLAEVVARGVLASLARSSLAADASDAFQPLAALSEAAERPALYKAAQRGSLATLRRDGRLLTTQAWLDAYRRDRATGNARGGADLCQTKDNRDGDDSRNARPQ